MNVSKKLFSEYATYLVAATVLLGIDAAFSCYYVGRDIIIQKNGVDYILRTIEMNPLTPTPELIAISSMVIVFVLAGIASAGLALDQEAKAQNHLLFLRSAIRFSFYLFIAIRLSVVIANFQQMLLILG